MPVKVRIMNWSLQDRALIGAKTGVSYGRQKDGNVILMWKSDAKASPGHFHILNAEQPNA